MSRMWKEPEYVCWGWSEKSRCGDPESGKGPGMGACTLGRTGRYSVVRAAGDFACWAHQAIVQKPVGGLKSGRCWSDLPLQRSLGSPFGKD